MKNKVCPALLAIAALFVCPTAQAFSLIGNNLTISLQSPLGTTLFSAPTTVAVGTSDQVNLSGLVVDPEVSFINVYNLKGATFPNLFLVVNGIIDTPTSLTVVTNMAGLNDSRLSFAANTLTVDLSGLLPPVTTDGFVDVDVCLWCTPVPTPDSGSTAGLLAVGVLGLAAVSRRCRQRIT